MGTPKSKKPKFILGLDIGGTKCAVVLGDERVRVRDRLVFATRPERGLRATLREFYATIDVILLRNGLTSRSVRRAGISCGGPLDSRKGFILSPPNLPGWNRVPIVKLIRRKLGCPVRLENDANAGALAEWKFGAGRGCHNLVFLTFGTGLGAGLILNGRLYRGTNDLAGEVGHIRLAPDGPLGYGKKGSFEGFCSGGGLAQFAKREGLTFNSAKELCAAAERGNPSARRILKTSSQYLGQGLAILIDLLNPEKIIIGGVYARSVRFFKAEAQRVIQRETLIRSRAVCRIAPAGLGEKIGDLASLSVALLED